MASCVWRCCLRWLGWKQPSSPGCAPKTGATDGNLGAQLLKLEKAGYVAVAKSFVQRKPQTLYRVADAGRTARTEYVRALRQLLGSVIS